jgi:hypothetical protein
MATASDFRRIVLGLPDATEGAHMAHPDFRVNGRIFASLNHDETRGMLVLTPEQQRRYVRANPAVFQPENGAWGRSGCTRVALEPADKQTLAEAAALAWQFCMAKPPGRSGTKRGAKKATPATTGRRSPPRRRS